MSLTGITQEPSLRVHELSGLTSQPRTSGRNYRRPRCVYFVGELHILSGTLSCARILSLTRN